jgi:methylglutaconyl-CoA hydratase
MTTAPAQLVLRSDEAGVARLVMNRPEKRNALNDELIAALKAALREADSDPDVRVISLAGAGPDFCAGMDLASLQKLANASALDHLADVDSLAELFLLIRSLDRPVIALVRGRALAGGCGLATACDLILAAESATFAYTEVRIGFIPAMVTAILRRNVTEKRAFELIVRGDPLGARDAERIGLVNRVYGDEEFDAEAGSYALELAGRSASAVQLCKRLLYLQDGMGFEAALRAGADLNVVARMTDDTRAGVARFLQRSGGKER